MPRHQLRLASARRAVLGADAEERADRQVAAADGAAGAPEDARVRDARRQELDLREPLLRGADGRPAHVRRPDYQRRAHRRAPVRPAAALEGAHRREARGRHARRGAQPALPADDRGRLAALPRQVPRQTQGGRRHRARPPRRQPPPAAAHRSRALAALPLRRAPLPLRAALLCTCCSRLRLRTLLQATVSQEVHKRREIKRGLNSLPFLSSSIY